MGHQYAPVPEALAVLVTDFKAIAGGGGGFWDHTVALKQDGTVVAWGYNGYGQATIPVGLSGVTAIAAGGNHTVALKQDLTVVAWGSNGSGQINVPTGLTGVIAIAAGGAHTVALKQDGTVAAWGSNSSGQNNIPSGLTGITAIAAGSAHTVVLKQDGTVAAWGWNGSGQTNIPAGLTGVSAIAADGNFTVALKQNGTVVAWGRNSYGQVSIPAGLTGVTAVAAGKEHTVALKQDGTVVVWGRNYDGEATVPAGLSGVSAIDAGGNHTLALKQDGTVVAWGANEFGQTAVPAGIIGVTAIAANDDCTVALKQDGTVVAWGRDGFGHQHNVPAGLTGVIAIAVGWYHTVALKQDGTVVAWGSNNHGQSTIPAGLTGVIAIAAGGEHTVALKQDGTVVAWGNNNYGQITIPAGLTGVIAIAARGGHTVALRQDGIVVAWGWNYHGQTNVPAGLTGVIAITASGGHTVALKQDGTVVAWGYNFAGQSNIPAGLTGVTAIAAGDAHTVALKQDGSVVAWGYGDYGQTTVPAGLPDVTAIVAGESVTFYHLASDLGPEVLQVGTGAIPSINGKQSVIITGNGFHPNCTVALRDHRTGEIFPNRAKVSQTASSIQLSVNFTSVPAEWSVEVENPDGKSSGRFRFQVGTPIVPGETVDYLEVTGDDSIDAGETATLSAILHYSDGSEHDVTGSAAFRVVGSKPNDVELFGNELQTGASTPTSTVVVSASIGSTSGGIESTFHHTVSIGGGFRVKIFKVTQEADPFTVLATSSQNETGGSYSYAWEFDGNDDFGDGPDERWTTYSYPTLGGRHTVKVRAFKNSTGEVAEASEEFWLQKPLASGQPIRPRTVKFATGLGGFLDPSSETGEDFGFDYDRIDNGLIILTHGMKTSGRASWLRDLATEIEGAVSDFHSASSLPNIAIYDWENDADISISKTFPSAIPGINRLPVLDENNLTDITANGITHGGHLANWIWTQVSAGLIDPDAPIHLIGHSAGGFVMGEAASQLNQAGIRVDRVTLLDTPKPWTQHLLDLKTDGTFVDRLITSYWGSHNYLNAPVPDGYAYTRSTYPFDRIALVNIAWNEWGHGLAYRRYEDTATVEHDAYLITDGVSFRNSPFIAGPLNPNRPGALVASGGPTPKRPRGPEGPTEEDTEQPITGLTSYGVIEQSGTAYTLIEDTATDSGIFAQLEVPVGAYAVSFSYQFGAGDEDDRLVASAGDDAVPVIVPNLPLYRTQEFQGWLDVAELGGSTATLDFRLEGTGDANSRVTISGIKFLISDDVDQDGILNVDEITLGTNPLRLDSDGDGLADHAEVQESFTGPTTADSDSDGVDDGVEVTAGTDPNSAASVFRITGISLDAEGNISLVFPCAQGKTYRLRGSTVPYGLTNWTIESGIQSETGSATVFDEGRQESDARFFYWVEVEMAE